MQPIIIFLLGFVLGAIVTYAVNNINDDDPKNTK